MTNLPTTQDRKRNLVPATLIHEANGQVEVLVEMPGVSKSDLDIHVEGLQLTVSGRRQQPALEGTWLLRERAKGDFTKTFSVDGSIDLDKIEANLANGLLTLTLPMKEASKPKKINIKSA